MAAATAEPRAVSLTAFVPAELKRDLADAAQANERTLSAEVRIALREHLVGRRPIAELVDAQRR
jgi:hypothetical protein